MKFSYAVPSFLKTQDEEVCLVLEKELDRQEKGLELIASENYVSSAVLAASGSLLTNKYAEGYPGKRYYGGCVHVDTVERLAIQRLRRLYDCEDSSVQPYMANVQAHSGAQANMAVFVSVLEPGDSILGLDLSHGGHLTHGSPVNFSGKWFQAHHYGVEKESECLDYSKMHARAKGVQAKLIVGGASAYPRVWDFERLSHIAKDVGAFLLVDMAHIAGLVATKLHPSPIPHADFVTSTTHKTLRGPRGGFILSKPEYAKKINSAIFPGIQGGPLMHTIAAKAVAFGEALDPSFTQYQKSVLENAKALASCLEREGLRVVSGGTDTHLLLLDLSGRGLTGKEVEKALEEVSITVNKNTIPFETKSPFITSGIRLGTPAVSTRGMGVKEMQFIGKAIVRICNDLSAKSNETDRLPSKNLVEEIRPAVEALCEKFPIYK